MSRIILGPDGKTRYRKVDAHPAYHDYVALENGDLDWYRGQSGATKVERLPFIPNWPGPSPEQYLSDDLNTPVKTGDLILSRDGNRWEFETIATAERADHCGQLAAWIDWDKAYAEGGKAQGVWLIRRADPTLDHDEVAQ